jgi:hypothetical protein
MPDAPATVTARIPVGVEVESRPGTSRWAGRIWRPVALRPGRRAIPDWTVLADADGVVRYYAGTASLVVRSTETTLYRDNIEARAPAVYVVLRRAAGPTGWTLLLATVDPSEAHAHADVGEDLVEALPMSATLRDWLAAFVARHHKERPHWKRQRDDKVPGRAPPPAEGEDEPFLKRWSRGKQGARVAPDGAPAPGRAPVARSSGAATAPPGLPSLDDIRTRGDVAAFLREGVPSELRLAALRRAWRLDPAIAAHRPLVDYDWNVNAPGYGRLRAADDPARLIEALFGHLRKVSADASPEERMNDPKPPPCPGASSVAECAEESPPNSEQERASPLAEAGGGPVAFREIGHAPGPRNRRRHGGAVPGRNGTPSGLTG